jgi:hypothetical protein
MSSSVFRDVTQRRLVVTDVAGQPIGPILKDQAVQDDCSTLQYATDRLYRHVGNYNLRCVTSQKTEELIYSTAEA